MGAKLIRVGLMMVNFASTWLGHGVPRSNITPECVYTGVSR